MSDATEALSVPEFGRLHEYAGLWALEPVAARSLWRFARGTDLAVHVKQKAKPILAQTEIVAGPAGKSIALIKVLGLLMKQSSSMGGTSTIGLRREIRNAANDPNIAGILLAVDSPGGTVSGTYDLAKEIRAAGKVKVVWAHVDDLCASAAFWAASQASRITANAPTALIGSIGAIQVIYDESQALEEAGIRTLVFATGALKGLGVPGAKVTDEQVTHVQGLIDAVQQSFDAAVREGRGLSAKELADVRHGGVMTAPDALAAKLIDAIQPMSKTLSQFAQEIKAADVPRSNGRVLATVQRRLPMLARS